MPIHAQHNQADLRDSSSLGCSVQLTALKILSKNRGQYRSPPPSHWSGEWSCLPLVAGPRMQTPKTSVGCFGEVCDKFGACHCAFEDGFDPQHDALMDGHVIAEVCRSRRPKPPSKTGLPSLNLKDGNTQQSTYSNGGYFSMGGAAPLSQPHLLPNPLSTPGSASAKRPAGNSVAPAVTGSGGLTGTALHANNDKKKRRYPKGYVVYCLLSAVVSSVLMVML